MRELLRFPRGPLKRLRLARSGCDCDSDNIWSLGSIDADSKAQLVSGVRVFQSRSQMPLNF